MIKIKYKALFTIDFPHPFYKSGKSSDILVIPSKECSELIKSLGLRFLQTEFGATLYGRVDNDDILSNALPEGTKFSFLLKLKRPSFQNISDLDLSKPLTSTYYFNNLKKNMLGGTPLLVADSVHKVVSNKDLTPVFTNSFSFSDANTVSSEQGKINFLDSGEVLEQSLENSKNLFNFSFDLNKASRGRATFSIDGVEKSSFFSLAANERPGLFGLIDIFYKASLPIENQFQNPDKSITTKNYSIAFLNRSTKWRYFVTKKFNQTIATITAKKTGDLPLTFTTTAGGTIDSFTVTSNKALFLKEEVLSGIILADGDGKVLVSSLPNPSLNLIKTEGEETFSDILITI